MTIFERACRERDRALASGFGGAGLWRFVAEEVPGFAVASVFRSLAFKYILVNVEPNIWTFGTLMNAAIKGKQLDRAFEVLGIIQQHNLVPNKVFFFFYLPKIDF